ncbi:MAG TPA: tripartite tricarboxylate transporter substrate binding protein [Burkholderiales bacterium]|nr:tripartite tricarboxylate transporter substrate binding protein [Burkholderiales bacterium]
MNKLVLLGAVWVAALSAAEHGWAQTDNYPMRPIRIISPFPPGGSVDLVGRLLGARLSEMLGQQVIVDNRTGASGTIGTELAARAAPDGYTLLVNTLPLVTNMFLFSRISYDVVNDFAPISLLTSSANVVVVHPSLPARSVRELLHLARSKPGALNYATAGAGSNPHLAGELFNHLGKVNIVAVHFKGGGPALIATMSGEVGIAFGNMAEASNHVKNGRLRALAVTGTKRSVTLPDVPTVAEAGLPGYEFVGWTAMLAPRNTPRPVIALLNDRIVKILRSPDQAQRFTERGFDVIASSPEELGAHLKSEVTRLGRVIKERGMKAD